MTVGPSLGRTTSIMMSNFLLTSLRSTNADLLKTQNAISTGLDIVKPSDDSSKTSAIMLVQSQLESRTQHQRNLNHADRMLNVTDAALKDVLDELLEAQAIGQGELSTDSTDISRKNQSALITQMLESMLLISNRDQDGVPLFTGNTIGNANGHAFESFLGGIRYVGSDKQQKTNVGMVDPVAFNTSGAQAFGAVSSRVKGSTDLNPNLQNNGKINDLLGVNGVGIRKGSIAVTVDGDPPILVDLSNIDRVSDVVDRVNNAIGGTAGTLSLGGSGGFALTAVDGHTLTIGESGSGKTAADLGLNVTATAPGGGGNVTSALQALDAKITPQTNLGAFAATIDFTSGLKITQSSINQTVYTKVADFSTANTVQDMINIVDQLGLGVKLEISKNKKSLNLVSTVSGLDFSVGEVAGGTTAVDLGVRSFNDSTLLSDFNFGLDENLSFDAANGKGKTAPTDPDFRFELHNGTQVQVNLQGDQSVGDVLASISSAAIAAGLIVGAPGDAGTDFNIGFVSDGNGFFFEDKTAGAADFKVVQMNSSLAAEKMGIYKDAGAGSAITGDDNAKVRTESIFTHLINLANNLDNNNTLGISIAVENIQKDNANIAQVRANVGVRSQRVTQELERSANLKIMEQSLLSDLRDVNMTEAITRFSQLQSQLQATFSVGAKQLQQSFLDFLR